MFGPPRRRAALNIALVVLALLLVIGAVLRVRHLTSSPGWFRDEGLYMEVAWNVAKGEARAGPLNVTWVSPFETHPPLYFLASGVWMHVTGALRGDYRANIQTFRWFSVGCGLLVLLGMWGVGTALGSALLALLTIAILVFDPWTVMFHRMGLPYNLLALEFVGALLLAHRYFETPTIGRLTWAAAVAATAPLTVYYGIALPVALWVAVGIAGRRRDLWLPPLAFIPLALFLAGVWRVHPVGLDADWAQFRVDSAGTWNLGDWAQDFTDLLSVSPLVPLGLLGLALLPRRGLSSFLQITVVLYLFLWLRRPHSQIWLHRADTGVNVPLITYPLIPLLAPLALGTSAALLAAWRHLRGDAVGGQAPGGAVRLRVVTALLAVVVGFTLLFMASASMRAIRGLEPHMESVPPARWGFLSPLAYDLAVMKTEAEGSPSTGPGVATFLSQQDVKPTDLIIAEYPLWWTIPGRHATLTQALAFLGEKTDFFTYPIPHERFAYPADWHTARFIVLDEMTSRWRAEFDPAIRAAVREIESRWRLVFRAGRLEVYAPRVFPPLQPEEINPLEITPESASAEVIHAF
jgi:hypothetical protein